MLLSTSIPAQILSSDASGCEAIPRKSGAQRYEPQAIHGVLPPVDSEYKQALCFQVGDLVTGTHNLKLVVPGGPP